MKKSSRKQKEKEEKKLLWMLGFDYELIVGKEEITKKGGS